MLQWLINKIGVEDYYFIVDKKNKYNTTGKIELWSLNGNKPDAIGFYNCFREILTYKFILIK